MTEERLPLPGERRDAGDGADTSSEKSRALIARYGCVVDGIARALGPSCEVVLHSIDDIGQSVVKIVNSHITGRSIGAPVTDLGLRVLEKAKTGGDDVVGPYFSEIDSKSLRSVTVLLRDDQGEPIGFLCMNMDLTAPFADIARAYLPEPLERREAAPDQLVEHFPASIRDLVKQALSASGDIGGSDRTRRMIEELNKKGIFVIKGAVEIAAEELGVSRHTIYYHLRDLRRPDGEPGEEG